MNAADLAAWQARLGLSQVEAAEKLRMPVQTYRNILKGRRHADGLPDAIALLCQLIEESGRGGSSPVTPHLVLSVSADEIRSLNQTLLVDLLRQLLHLEAESAGLLRSGIHVPAQINVADGGEDGRIEWTAGPDQTAFLPSRLVLFQVKAADMPPAKCAAELREKDGSAKGRIVSTLSAGGSYVIFCNRACTQAMIDERIARMRQALADGLPGVLNPPHVDFWDANKIADWTNLHYPAALWVIERVRPGGILPLQSLERWGSDRRLAEFRFVDDGRVERVADGIGRLLSSPRGVLRIAGLSGLGKTRLAFEALNRSPEHLRARVLYTNSAFGTERILAVVQAIREFGKSAIIVVDDCPPDMHRALAAIVERADSKLSLLTIDYDPAAPSTDYASITIPQAADKVITDIVRQVAHGVGDADANRLAQFAQGFPQIAVLIAKAWPFDTYNISSLTDKDLIEKMVFGRDEPNAEQFALTQALSLYDTVGVEEEAAGELATVASAAGINPEAAYGHVQTLIERGIVQKRGRFVQVQPKPLALALAADLWKRMAPGRIDTLAVVPSSERLTRALFRQFAGLDGLDKARQIVERLCEPGRPYTQATFLDNELHAECLAQMAEVNPAAVVGALEHAFVGMAVDALRRLTRGRRWLVWTLEKLCFPEETFERASRLLLDFAVAENEDRIGNNATARFQSLFKVYLSGTETPAINRLNVIDEALASGDLERKRIAVAALQDGLEVWHFSRFGGAERQGSGPDLKDWTPSTKAELVEYYRACLGRLVDIACGHDDLSVAAKKHLAGTIRGLIGRGLVDDIAAMVDRVLASGDPYWPDAIEQTAMSLSFEGRGMSPVYRQKVEGIHARLTPNSLENRLRLYVCELPWGYYEEGANVVESGDRRAKALAKECIENWSEFLTLLPTLLRGEQRHSHALGRHIIESVDSREDAIDAVLACLGRIPSGERNPALLGGMIAGAEKRDSAMIDRKLDAIASNGDMIPLLPWLTMQTHIEQRDLERIVVELRAGRIVPDQARVLAMGSALSHLPATVLGFFVEALMETEPGGYWAAVEVIGMYVFQRVELCDPLRPQLRRLMEGFSMEKLDQSHSAMDSHHFCDLASWLIRHGSADADAALAATVMAQQAVRWCVEDSSVYRDRRMIERLLPVLFEHCWSVVWPILSASMGAHRDVIYRFDSLLRVYELDGNSVASPIFSVPWDVLRAWCHSHPEYGPAFLMRIAPVFERRSTPAKDAPQDEDISPDGDREPEPRQWNPIVLRLLDDFGDRAAVLEALGANIMTFMWRGSRVPYFEQYATPLKTLLKHHRPSVTAWARRQLVAQQQSVRHEQARDDEQEFGIF
jgi:hypothetical protein